MSMGAVFVDEGGVGAGIVDRLRHLGVPFVFVVNFGSAAERWDGDCAKPLYANKRADLCGVEYGYNGKGEIQLEKKEDIKHGLASPDMADALALTLALPVSGAAWDLPTGKHYYKTTTDLFVEFDDDYWYGDDND